jgi:hypothetical protein
MSHNNIIYDEGAYKKSINESVGPGIYRLAEPRVSCEPCYPYAPSIRLQKSGDSVSSKLPLVDIDSELMNITRKLSKDPMKQYIPHCPNSMCTSGEVCGQGVVGRCNNMKSGSRFNDTSLTHFKDCQLPAEDTRLSNPSCNLRSSGWNRWEWLCKDPQENVFMPFDYNISNRLIVKDNHRPCIPNPIDQTLALPLGGELPCDSTITTCASYTIPSSVGWQTSNNIRRY